MALEPQTISSRKWRWGKGGRTLPAPSHQAGDTETQNFARSLGAVWVGGSAELPQEKLDAAIIYAPVGALDIKAVGAAQRQAMHASVQSYSTLKAEPNVTFCKANVALGGSAKENAGNTFAQKTYVVTYKLERFFNDKITLIYDSEDI